MNKQRRKEISDILSALQDLHARLETVKDEEQEYYDNMPESFQNGEKGQAAEQTISNLEDAHSELESCINNLEGIDA